MNERSRVLVALRVPVTADRAFAAFTEQIGQWWQPSGLFQFTPGRSGTLAFDPGPGGRLVETYPDGEAFIIGHIRIWDPPNHLALTWRHATFAPDQETELHVRFEGIDADDTQTRITIEHFGWDAIPAEHAARHGFPLETFQLRFAQWWRVLLQSLLQVTVQPPGARSQSPPASDWTARR